MNLVSCKIDGPFNIVMANKVESLIKDRGLNIHPNFYYVNLKTYLVIAYTYCNLHIN